ncbi:hypothetical protein DH2020_035489 [Rehmannia glutinosa]|uniref:J domain-containing protein n=1 Tax=Rehmannia glutinosa TaxID=99300 RepID=A0ABR0V9P8_REHGL
MNKEEADERKRDNPSPHPNRGYRDKEEDMRLWGILIFGLIGATVTTFAELRYEFGELWMQYGEKVPFLFGIQALCLSHHGRPGILFEIVFKRKHGRDINRRILREEYETEMERVERIRRMQSVFNRERNKSKRRHDNWQQYGPGAYHQHFQRNDWYWKEDASFRDHGSNFRETPWASASSPLSHHYSVLGLDRLRTKPYTDDEIKSAFRAKAKEFHPDQNQDNKEFAEAKFKEVMVSYEAIKSERKNNRHP